jgi:hypothetical protein
MTSAAIIAMVAAGGRRSRLRRAVTGYRSARRLLRTPASRQSRNGLDWTNFFIADIQTGFGTFVAFYLADLGWSEASVGLALATGGLAGVAGQIPGGALTDAVPWKRGLIAAGILMICAAALIFALAPTSDLCAACVAEVKARHRIDPRRRPTERERAILEREVAAVREAILRREAGLPGASATRRILKAARLAIELDSRGTNAMGQILKDELVNKSRVPAGV